MAVDLKELILGRAIEELPKSSLPASAARLGGKYPFFCSSPEPLTIDEAIAHGDTVIMGTGGNATVHLGRGDFCYSTDTWAFRSRTDELSTRYLWRWLQHELPWISYRCFQGTGLKHLQKDDVRAAVIRVADPLEQSRIAAVLDTVDAAIAKTKAVIAKLNQVRAGLFHDLLTRGLDAHGKLRDPIAHPEQFQDSPLGRAPRDWEVKTCDSVCREIVVGIVVKPAQYYVREGVPVLRSANILEGRIQLTDLVFISPETNALLSKSMLYTDDLVTVRTGYPGTTSVVPPDLNGANCVDLIISRPGQEILPRFLALWVNSPFGKDQVLRAQGGLAQQHFNVGEMKRLLVAKPQRAEQQEIVARVGDLDALLKCEARSLSKLTLLKSGLMTDLLTGRVRVPASLFATTGAP